MIEGGRMTGGLKERRRGLNIPPPRRRLEELRRRLEELPPPPPPHVEGLFILPPHILAFPPAFPFIGHIMFDAVA